MRPLPGSTVSTVPLWGRSVSALVGFSRARDVALWLFSPPAALTALAAARASCSLSPLGLSSHTVPEHSQMAGKALSLQRLLLVTAKRGRENPWKGTNCNPALSLYVHIGINTHMYTYICVCVCVYIFPLYAGIQINHISCIWSILHNSKCDDANEGKEILSNLNNHAVNIRW